jgi:hypothetical protein
LASPFLNFNIIFTKKSFWFPLWFPQDFQEKKKASEALILQGF